MGIVNVTPDSFSDGGRYMDPSNAIEHGLELERQGATYLDIGGESTRPGAAEVPADEESRRVIPVVEGLIAAGTNAKLSVDSSKSEVIAKALDAGATLVNDVTALRHSPEIAEMTASAGAELCLMHMLGSPRTMQEAPHYEHDVVDSVKSFLEERMAFAIAHGVPEDKIILDPGIGFGKTLEHNLELLRRLHELVALGRPLLVGTSRKSFLGKLTGRDTQDRLAATLATNVVAYLHGGNIFRVHDVWPVVDALTVAAATTDV